jgi:hypothetical protein
MNAKDLQAFTQASVDCQQQLLDFLRLVPIPTSTHERETFERLLANAASAHSRWLEASRIARSPLQIPSAHQH